MERARRPYSIQKRLTTKKNRFRYYIQFRNPETGSYMTAVSSGASSKGEAQNWADDQIKAGKIILTDKKNILFDAFTKDFWDWDKSTYVRGKLARGQQIGRTHVKTCAGYIDRHVLPVFKGRTLSSIKPVDIENWLLDMKKRGEHKTKSINLFYMALKTIFKEAHRMGYISTDPTISIKPFAEDKFHRGILTKTEMLKLFSVENFSAAWKQNHKLYAANLLAASTGMREGEIRGLRIGDIHDGYIDIQHAWEQGFGLKGAKWDSNRMVTVPASVMKIVTSLIDISPYGNTDDFVFYGECREKPLHSRAFINSLYNALAEIGIDENARKARLISFHSWRHFFNSVMRGHVPDEKLRLMTGHRTEEMTEHYTHPLEEDYKEAKKVQDDVFGSIKLHELVVIMDGPENVTSELNRPV